MPSIGSHANVFETCLQILERRGYRLTMTLPEEDEVGHWCTAERDGFSFAGDNPIELLGLVAIYEEIRPSEDRPYWWSAQNDSSRVWDRLTDEAISREEARNAELEELRTKDPSQWETKVRDAFEQGYDQTNAAAFLEVTRAELRRILEDPRLADLRSRPAKPDGFR